MAAPQPQPLAPLTFTKEGLAALPGAEGQFELLDAPFAPATAAISALREP